MRSCAHRMVNPINSCPGKQPATTLPQRPSGGPATGEVGRAVPVEIVNFYLKRKRTAEACMCRHALTWDVTKQVTGRLGVACAS
eukprot:6180074-Pleurochrysis_carterae.AAC.1